MLKWHHIVSQRLKLELNPPQLKAMSKHKLQQLQKITSEPCGFTAACVFLGGDLETNVSIKKKPSDNELGALKSQSTG